jgi:hypothetical protein
MALVKRSDITCYSEVDGGDILCPDCWEKLTPEESRIFIPEFFSSDEDWACHCDKCGVEIFNVENLPIARKQAAGV